MTLYPRYGMMKPIHISLLKPKSDLTQPGIQLVIALSLAGIGLIGTYVKSAQGRFVPAEDFVYPVLILMGLALSGYYAVLLSGRKQYFIRITDHTITYRTRWEDEVVTIYLAAVDYIDVELYLVRFFMKSGTVLELDLSEENISCRDIRRLQRSITFMRLPATNSLETIRLR
jgi:hypothetical protein